MKPPHKKDNNDEILKILKRVSARVEDATIDIHSLKIDVKDVKLRMNALEKNTDLIRVDVENLKEDVREVKSDVKNVKKEIHSIIENQTEIFSKMVTQKEFSEHTARISSIERILKAS